MKQAKQAVQLLWGGSGGRLTAFSLVALDGVGYECPHTHSERRRGCVLGGEEQASPHLPVPGG